MIKKQSRNRGPLGKLPEKNLENTMKSLVSMAMNGHFPYLRESCSRKNHQCFLAIKKLSILSPYQARNILHNKLMECRERHSFNQKMKTLEILPFEEKVLLTKALITLAEDLKLEVEKLMIH